MSDFSQEEQTCLQNLKQLGQDHIIEVYKKHSSQDRKLFINQLSQLNLSYPGGLKEYVSRSQKLLWDSANNVNPYEGYVPDIPKGRTVDFQNSEEFEKLEKLGLEEIRHAGFVLVAGGLGERLGYDDSKVSIYVEILTKTTFLQYYIEYIQAFQSKTGVTQIPLAIMVSDDTEKLILHQLEKNNYYGMPKDQITLMKQEKVPALIDNMGRFALVENKLEIETKPHGHGDVHSLLYMTGTLKKWKELNKKWVVFFQDTNPLSFRAFPALLGVSQELNLEMNSLTCPRKPGEAVGSICALKHSSGNSLTVNVEYNQIEALFKACKCSEPIDEKGFSKYPGNINIISLRLEEYYENLEITKGNITEFINPKYADSSKTIFKSATRLECMMQDYPKLLKSGDRVGITQMDRNFCFSTVKNDLISAAAKAKTGLAPESASSCEYDVYKLNQDILRLCGVEVESPSPSQMKSFGNIPLNFGAKIIIKPSFGVTIEEIKSKIKGNNKISAQSTLILDGDFTIENLELDGSLWARNTIKNLTIVDQNYLEFIEIDQKDASIPSNIKIRAYDVVGIEKIHKN